MKGETQIVNLSEKLNAGGIAHKLWIEQPENIPTCLATKPYPKSTVSLVFKKLKLCKWWYIVSICKPIFGHLVCMNYLQLWCINASHQMLECLFGFLWFSDEIQLLFYWNQIRISRKMNVPTSEKNVKIHSFNDLAIPIGNTRQRLMRRIKRFWESQCANILLPRFSTQPNSKYENIELQFNTTEKLQQNPISNAIVKNRKKKEHFQSFRYFSL